MLGLRSAALAGGGAAVIIAAAASRQRTRDRVFMGLLRKIDAVYTDWTHSGRPHPYAPLPGGEGGYLLDGDGGEPLDVGDGHRAREQESLAVGHAERLQHAELLARLDALGDDLRVHLAREAHEGLEEVLLDLAAV